jgi:hypothetical protein
MSECIQTISATLMGLSFLLAGLSQTAKGEYPQDVEDKVLTRIAFGSCAHQDKDQPIWNAVLAQQPELFVFLGDNIYGDILDMEVLKEKYELLAARSGFQELWATTDAVATWDDHDHGQNDAGLEHPMKVESKEIFLDLWGELRERLRSHHHQLGVQGSPDHHRAAQCGQRIGHAEHDSAERAATDPSQ